MSTPMSASMRVVSIQVGRPREVLAKGRIVSTAIFKHPVAGRVMLRRLNLDGDQQADLTVHGGPEKAVYVYPAEHYAFWRAELPDMDLPYGMFGENLTVEGLREDDVFIGDTFRIGEAEVTVAQPRVPCYKLGLKFGRGGASELGRAAGSEPGERSGRFGERSGRLGRDDILKRFLHSGRSGWYLSVSREGEIGPGDPIERLSRDPHGLAIRDVIHLYAEDRTNVDLLRSAIAVPTLPAVWRDHFLERLDRLAR